LLKDVTAMANTSGEDLVIGTAEEEGMFGTPGLLNGLANGDVEAERILQICSAME
jgi:hypothetical protein